MFIIETREPSGKSLEEEIGSTGSLMNLTLLKITATRGILVSAADAYLNPHSTGNLTLVAYAVANPGNSLVD